MESKKYRGIMEAYSSIYEEKEESEMEAGEKGKKDEGGKHKEGKHPKGKEEKGEKVTEKEGKETEKEMKESADLFDYILEHLVAEGYADTNKAALAIMANMSEEWKQDIVEAAKDQSNKQIEKGVKTTYKAGNVLDNQHQGRSRGLSRLPAGEREAKTKRMRGRLKARRDDLFGERNKREDEARAEMKKKYGL